MVSSADMRSFPYVEIDILNAPTQSVIFNQLGPHNGEYLLIFDTLPKVQLSLPQLRLLIKFSNLSSQLYAHVLLIEKQNVVKRVLGNQSIISCSSM